MDKGNCVVKFEFHYQMCEFLAHSKELIISFVTYQISAFKFSLHHLHNRQSITSETTDCLVIPLALVSRYTGAFIISLLTALRYVDFKSAGKREKEPWRCHKC